jgi:hypothetical protein
MRKEPKLLGEQVPIRRILCSHVLPFFIPQRRSAWRYQTLPVCAPLLDSTYHELILALIISNHFYRGMRLYTPLTSN